MLPITLLLIGGSVLLGSFALGDFSEEDKLEDEEEQENEQVADVGDLLDAELNLAAEAEPDEICFEFTHQDLEALPTPLADWTLNGDIEIIDAENCHSISFEFPDEVGGTLLVMDANYFEGSRDGTSEFGTEYVGQNVYFVPDGTNFPNDYLWSEEGGTLFNSSTFVQDVDDFNGIKFLGRIETGQIESADGMLSNQPVYAPDILINSNLNINYT